MTTKRIYLRPPKKMGAQNTASATPLGDARKMIVHDWTAHAMDEHEYPSDRGAALATFKCFVCQDFIEALWASEITEENEDD